MSEVNYYSILGLSDDDKNLNEKDFNEKLKKSYKNLARKWHPDKFSTKSEAEKKEAEEKFKEISEAYNTLSDPQKRQEYDFKQNGGMGDGFDPFGGFNPWDIFNRAQASQRQQMYKGQNVDVEVEITLEEAYTGGEKEVTYNTKTMCGNCNGTGSADGKTHTCPHCNGTGTISERRQHGNMTMINNRPCQHCNGTGKSFSEPCPHCHGEGMKTVTNKIKITIPAGVINGAYQTLQGKGCELPKGYNGVSGDLNVFFIVLPHKDFIPEPNGGLRHVLNLNVIDALLGCEKKIKCIDGSEVSVKIHERVNNNHVFVIKGKGMPIFNGNGKGDMRVVVQLEMPNSLSNKQRELLKKIRDCK